MCVARVDDGRVLTSSVVDGWGFFHLALPEGYDAEFAVECVTYDEAGGEGDADDVSPERYNIEHQPPAVCDRRGFQPGYYDREAGVWRDQCTGIESDTSGGTLWGEAALFGDFCPLGKKTRGKMNRGMKDVWISFVGDSVTRQLLTDGFPAIGIDVPRHARGGKRKRMWYTDRTGGVWRHPDFMLLGLGDPDNRIWISYTMDFVRVGSETLGATYTWGDFVRERGEGPRDDDPDWPDERAPDVVFYSPGYMAPGLTAAEYGAVFDQALMRWQGAMNDVHGAPMPPVHVSLNIPPAPWLIPDNNAEDRRRRTRLNEYRKNLAILDVVKRYDFVESVVDAFSVALPLNGHPGLGDTRHTGPVQILDKRYLRVIADKVVRAFCHTAIRRVD